MGDVRWSQATSRNDFSRRTVPIFWCVVIAGIARIDFRRFSGYGLVFAAIWFVTGVVVFTFAPS